MEDYYKKGVYPATYKILVLGDVHGDKYATINSLKKGGVIDNNLNWKAGKAHVVQMGDILDRGGRFKNMAYDEDSEFDIINLFLKLMTQAYKAGGGFHCILGNHELMNIMGNFSFTSRKGITHFKKRALGRRVFFFPGSKMCRIFAKYWNPIIKIGKYIFCHGGLSYNISAKYSIPNINKLMRSFLMGNKKLLKNTVFNQLFLDSNSLLWNRKFSNGNFCIKRAHEILRKKKCSYMVVGHTPQKDGINIKKGIVWCVDTGMSTAFGNRLNDSKLQMLQIINNGKKVKIIK